MSETTATTTAADGLRARALSSTPPIRSPAAAHSSRSTTASHLDGNSLGALPVHVPARAQDVLARQWGELRIRSWDESGWWTAPERIGDRIAPLVGAAAGQLVDGDSPPSCTASRTSSPPPGSRATRRGGPVR
ncbi:kynureninase [Streptomyces californicus]